MDTKMTLPFLLSGPGGPSTLAGTGNASQNTSILLQVCFLVFSCLNRLFNVL